MVSKRFQLGVLPMRLLIHLFMVFTQLNRKIKTFDASHSFVESVVMLTRLRVVFTVSQHVGNHAYGADVVLLR